MLKKAVTCSICHRIVWESDVDERGRCCFCQDKDEPKSPPPRPQDGGRLDDRRSTVKKKDS